jgi:hypothetical protein
MAEQSPGFEAARQRQFEDDAAEQVRWEQEARAEWEKRQTSAPAAE